MPGDYLPDDLKILWKELSTTPLQISPDELRKEARKLRTGLRRRSILGGGVALIVIVGFTLFFIVFQNKLQRIGSMLTVMGAGFVVVQLRMRPARALPDLGETDCMRFFRSELKRQRDFHRGKWLWSRLLIFLPGPLIFCVGFAQAHPEKASFIRMEFVAFLVIAAIAVPLNLRLARRYQSRIDSLDRSQKRSHTS